MRASGLVLATVLIAGACAPAIVESSGDMLSVGNDPAADVQERDNAAPAPDTADVEPTEAPDTAPAAAEEAQTEATETEDLIVAPEPTVAATPEPSPVPAPPEAPTSEPDPTAVPNDTETAEAAPEASATPEPTSTPEPTATPEPTTAPEATATPEPTATAEPTVTPVPSPTPSDQDEPGGGEDPGDDPGTENSVVAPDDGDSRSNPQLQDEDGFLLGSVSAPAGDRTDWSSFVVPPEDEGEVFAGVLCENFTSSDGSGTLTVTIYQADAAVASLVCTAAVPEDFRLLSFIGGQTYSVEAAFSGVGYTDWFFVASDDD